MVTGLRGSWRIPAALIPPEIAFFTDALAYGARLKQPCDLQVVSRVQRMSGGREGDLLQLLAAASRYVAETLVDLHETARRHVDRCNPHGRLLEERPEALFAGPQCLLGPAVFSQQPALGRRLCHGGTKPRRSSCELQR